jgi:hypothetical protein
MPSLPAKSSWSVRSAAAQETEEIYFAPYFNGVITDEVGGVDAQAATKSFA